MLLGELGEGRRLPVPPAAPTLWCCGLRRGLLRSRAPEGAADRDAVRTVLGSRQLEAYSDALIADLRASATIVGE